MCPVHLHCTTICGCDMWCKDKQQSNQPKYSADVVYIEISPSIAHISPATFEHTYEQYCWVSIIESLRFCNPLESQVLTLFRGLSTVARAIVIWLSSLVFRSFPGLDDHLYHTIIVIQVGGYSSTSKNDAWAQHARN